jgi:hypothetical protein
LKKKYIGAQHKKAAKERTISKNLLIVKVKGQSKEGT